MFHAKRLVDDSDKERYLKSCYAEVMIDLTFMHTRVSRECCEECGVVG